MINSEQKAKLMQAATDVMANRYPKDHSGTYGAAVLTKEGNIYSASQYFSDSYSLTLHAEQVAIVHAGAAHGEGTIIAIAITSNEKTKGVTYPCSMCKQLLWESRVRSGLPMLVICFSQDGLIEEYDLDSLIPCPWPKNEK